MHLVAYYDKTTSLFRLKLITSRDKNAETYSISITARMLWSHVNEHITSRGWVPTLLEIARNKKTSKHFRLLDRFGLVVNLMAYNLTHIGHHIKMPT
jgi:hypothetical protein